MRIAQVSPLWEQVPPPGYGGIELVVGHLTDELCRRGHQVTLFASGDSQTLAHLDSVCLQALRLDPNVIEPAIYDVLQYKRVLDRANEFDIIHFHSGYSALPYAEILTTPVVHTLHNGFNPENQEVFRQYGHQNYISISDAQQQQVSELNFVRTVHNAIAIEDYPFITKPDNNPPYLAFLGRLSPEKGPHHAIEIAKRTGWSLKMAGKIDAFDRRYFAEEIAPHIDGDQIQYYGELSHSNKASLLGHATATLFPITWDEPFGLVTIESMCTGTPVIALSRGAVPEIITQGTTGFICHSIEEMVAAVSQVKTLNRQHSRDLVSRSFSVSSMVEKYEAAYQNVLHQRWAQNGHRGPASPLVVV
ncbi:glycosyltransferase family 4 protein [Geitlerinema sp. P-1104]|uniref:glycosyltransferase family 4 protein n=1 Tax=Geitlerinema sp. P-1104 TaxID=2546230 RepID=UPI00147702DF|nr:glycosyltransferase family 4 protein [Geitlerinema sp. P-1104]NMG58890.1 glycosyltransferase family 4 protein [Geitlerinema sp. P-1104]